jgi:hypothetical protein
MAARAPTPGSLRSGFGVCAEDGEAASRSARSRSTGPRHRAETSRCELGFDYVIRFCRCITVRDATGNACSGGEWVPSSGRALLLPHAKVLVTSTKSRLWAPWSAPVLWGGDQRLHSPLALGIGLGSACRGVGASGPSRGGGLAPPSLVLAPRTWSPPSTHRPPRADLDYLPPAVRVPGADAIRLPARWAD